MKQQAMAAHTKDTSGLGKLLRRAREARGLTLEQVSNETKIPRHHLAALEQDNTSAVPVEFYRRAEIRAYARAVRLDPKIVLAELERVPKPPVAREPVVERVRGQKPTLFRNRALIAIGVLLAAGVFGRVLVERERARESGTHVASADSRHSANAARDTDLGVGTSQRPQEVPVAPPLPPSDSPPAAAIETTGDRASASKQPRELTVASPLPPSDSPPAAAIETTGDRASASKRPQEVPVASPLPPSDSSPAAIETTGDRASAASNGDPALTTGQGEARVSADSVTELVVSTQPEGARVTVDGIGWGTAPVTIRYLPAGQKLIRVTKDGYATEERMVHVVQGHPTTVDFQLRSAP